MNRRTFNKLLGVGALGSVGGFGKLDAKQTSVATTQASLPKWPDETYRRLLIDMHVPDWDPALLAKFDPVDYVNRIASAGVQSFMQYANSHVGLCLWRTKIGQMHVNLKGRDFFGEVLQECKRHGLHVVAYYSLVFDNWAFEHHPDWRIIPDEGSVPTHVRRYGLVCPNSPYREHALACLRELVGNYEFSGIFLDMVFWPDVCYCPHCITRFWQEAGTEPPRIVDWDDPTWRKFQAARQHWMLEFAQAVTRTIKATRPITVCHQYSSLFYGWRLGAPLELRDAMDYVGGDFYGGAAQHSLVCKAFHGLTPHRPLEFMTSRTRNLHDHVTIKPIEEIRTESFVAPLHSAAFLMIDAINVDGTLNRGVYKYMAELNAERAPYEPYYGGDLLADVAIYFDKESVYNPDEQKVRVGQLRAIESSPHRDAVVGLARILREAHMPFGVVTNATLDQLKNYRAVLLPTVFEMTAKQAAHFRKFVEAGGVVYASGPTSLDRFDKAGPRFMLEDVFGVRYAGNAGTKWTYLSPKDDAVRKLLWPQEELIFAGPMLKAVALPGAEVLATVTLPFVAPEVGQAIGSHFGAIHSNPPALTPGTDPGLVIHAFGKGKAIWVAAPIEISTEEVNARLVAALLKRALPGPYHFEVEAHPSVEMTLFHQPAKKRLLAGLLTMQQQLPPIPVPAKVRVQVPMGEMVTAVVHLPERKPLKFKVVGPYVEFDLEPFEYLSMALVEYHG